MLAHGESQMALCSHFLQSLQALATILVQFESSEHASFDFLFHLTADVLHLPAKDGICPAAQVPGINYRSEHPNLLLLAERDNFAGLPCPGTVNLRHHVVLKQNVSVFTFVFILLARVVLQFLYRCKAELLLTSGREPYEGQVKGTRGGHLDKRASRTLNLRMFVQNPHDVSHSLASLNVVFHAHEVLNELNVSFVQEAEKLELQIGVVELANSGVSGIRLALSLLEHEQGSQCSSLETEGVKLFRAPFEVVIVLAHHHVLLQVDESLSLQAYFSQGICQVS